MPDIARAWEAGFAMLREKKPQLADLNGAVSYEASQGEGGNDFEMIKAAHARANREGKAVGVRDATFFIKGPITDPVCINTTTFWDNVAFVIDEADCATIFAVCPAAGEEEDVDQLEDERIYVFQSQDQYFYRGRKETAPRFRFRTICLGRDFPAYRRSLPMVAADGWTASAISASQPLYLVGPATFRLAGNHNVTYAPIITIQNRANTYVEGLHFDLLHQRDDATAARADLNLGNVYNTYVKSCTVQEVNRERVAGTYGLGIGNANRVCVEDVASRHMCADQSIRTWGASGTNHIRNIIFKNCDLSRYDAHFEAENWVFENCRPIRDFGVRLGFTRGRVVLRDLADAHCDEAVVNLRSDTIPNLDGVHLLFERVRSHAPLFSYRGRTSMGLHPSLPDIIEANDCQFSTLLFDIRQTTMTPAVVMPKEIHLRGSTLRALFRNLDLEQITGDGAVSLEHCTWGSEIPDKAYTLRSFGSMNPDASFSFHLADSRLRNLEITVLGPMTFEDCTIDRVVFYNPNGYELTGLPPQ